MTAKLSAALTCAALAAAALAAPASARVHADFDGDGFDDLAIGIPGQPLKGKANAGAVQVVFGRKGGLGGRVKTLRGTGKERFGSALAVGDFNRDGFDDLAVGAPERSTSGDSGSGAVIVFFGKKGGLSARGTKTIDRTKVAGGVRPAQHFGAALTAGDFDGDKFDDLAIGAPEDRQGASESGAVNVVFGGKHGLDVRAHSQLIAQGKGGVRDDAEAGDHYGAALAAADFDGNGADDLAAGVPGEALMGIDAGAVSVVYGKKGKGLTGQGDQLINQDTDGVPGTAMPGDDFGAAVATGDFDGDRRGDLAIGAPGTMVGASTAAGAVTTIYGAPGGGGLNPANAQVLNQDSSGIQGTAGPNDEFGRALAAGDTDGDGADDLAVGVPGESETVAGAGAVAVIRGSASGLTDTGDDLFDQDTAGVGDSAESGDAFGAAVAMGDYNGDRKRDLAVAAPLDDVQGHSDAGAVNVLFGSGGGTTTDGSELLRQGEGPLGGDPQDGDGLGSALGTGRL